MALITTSPLALRSFFENEARFLSREGFHLCAISSPGDKLDEFRANTGVPTFAVPIARGISPFRDLPTLGRLWWLLRRRKPEMVHAHTPKAGLLAMTAAWLAGVNVRVYTIHGLPLMTRTGWKRQLLCIAEKATCMVATRVHCVSPSLREVVIELGICGKSKVQTLGSGSCAGVSLTRFDPGVSGNCARAQFGIPPDASLLAFVGRLVNDKGIRELAIAWHRLREEFAGLHLLLCGEFETEDPVPPHIRESLLADPRVHFTHGFVSNMPPVYAAIDVCVLPSYREGLPTVALECAAMEVPIVATRIPGCVDAVQDGITGLLVEPRCADALTEAISRLLRNRDLCVRMGKAARVFVAARFSQEKVFELLLQEYQRLLMERAPFQSRAHEGTLQAKY